MKCLQHQEMLHFNINSHFFYIILLFIILCLLIITYYVLQYLFIIIYLIYLGRWRLNKATISIWKFRFRNSKTKVNSDQLIKLYHSLDAY